MEPVPFPDTAIALLVEYLGQEDLAQALGVSAPVLAGWARGTSDPGRADRGRIALLVFACQELGPFAADARALGRWLMRANPALGGAAPAAFLLDAGIEAYDAVIEASGYGPAVDAARPMPGDPRRGR